MTVSRRSFWLLCSVLALLATTAAGAHILPQPAFVAQGVPETISLVVPNERAPHSTVGVEVTLPRGFTLVSAAPTDGWDATSNGRTVTWTGGPLRGTSTATFRVTLETSVEPGPVTLEAVQRYDDGRSVDWKVPLSVVPGLVQDGGTGSGSSWTLPAGVVVLVVGGSLVALLLARRRRRT